MAAHPLARNFIVTDDDVEFLTGVLLEQETPRTTEELALILLDKRLSDEKDALESRYKGAKTYSPAQEYAAGDRLIFSRLDFATAIVRSIRAGDNPDYGSFNVITVEFDDPTYNSGGAREFAAGYVLSHPLSQDSPESHPLVTANGASSAREILDSSYRAIIKTMHDALLG